MSSRLLKVPFVAVALILAVSLLAAQPPNRVAEPLPKGAKVRFGVSRYILRTGPAVALVPPHYTHLLAPTMNGGIRRYNLATGQPVGKGVPVGPGQVVVSADGKRAAVARTGALTVVEVATGKQLLAVQAPQGVHLIGIPGVALSADGKVLAYGARSNDNKGVVVVWDVDNNQSLAEVETHQPVPVYPTLSADGKTLITHGPPAPAPKLSKLKASAAAPKLQLSITVAEALRTAQVWEVASGKELFQARVTGMGGKVVAAAFSPDGTLVAASAGDGTTDLWEVKTGKRVRTLLGLKGQGVRVAFSPDGQKIATVAPDYRIQRWEVNGKRLDVSDRPPGVLVAQITGLVFADNERVIAWLTAAQLPVAWEGPTVRMLSPEMDHVAGIHSLAFPPEGKILFTSGSDGRLFRWNVDNGQLEDTLHVRPARMPGEPRITPVVTLSADGTRGIWGFPVSEVYDMSTGADLFCIPPPSSPPVPTKNMIGSADGMKVITLSRQAGAKRTGRCVVWDLVNGQRLAELAIPANDTPSAPMAMLSPDASRLVVIAIRLTADRRPALVLTGFDLKTGKKLGEVEDTSAPVGRARITVAVADNTTAVVTSSWGRMWTVDYVNGQVGAVLENLPMRGELPYQGPIVFSPDGKRFATGVVGEPFTTYGVRVYAWPQGKVLHTFVGHRGPVTTLRFTPDGRYLASGSQDTSVLLWDLSKLPRKE